jgi:pimeloyl-ACP methyl ester carboxylesterase
LFFRAGFDKVRPVKPPFKDTLYRRAGITAKKRFIPRLVPAGFFVFISRAWLFLILTTWGDLTGENNSRNIIVLSVLPGRTDSAISDFNTPHQIYIRRGLVYDPDTVTPKVRNELLLWIPGTSAIPAPATRSNAANGREGSEAFCKLAANVGYHVVSLRYPNSISASAARLDDKKEFENFRRAIIAGGASKYITVERKDSIENRLIKLLRYLSDTRPDERWGQFLTAESGINWEKIAVAGQSQGGGHAALIAIQHRVARVICTGSPKDYNLKLNAPAAWLFIDSATPNSRYFAFNHRQDRQAATWQQQLENLRALKLDAFGSPVDVDIEAPPYRHSRILFTNYPGGTINSKEAHTSVISWRNAAVFEPVWRYMLTEPVE